MIIIPTVLEKEFGLAEKRIEGVKESSKWVQIDVTDGVFVEGKTFDLELLNKLDFRSEDLLWEIHLMVKEPIDWVEKCLFVGASRIIGQVEMMDDRNEFIKKIKDEGVEAGLAFNPETEVTDIPDETDEILLMGRKAGFGYFDFEERVYKKIEMARKFGKILAIDGGVSENNLEKLKEAGVDVVYSGNNYFGLINGN